MTIKDIENMDPKQLANTIRRNCKKAVNVSIIASVDRPGAANWGAIAAGLLGVLDWADQRVPYRTMTDFTFKELIVYHIAAPWLQAGGSLDLPTTLDEVIDAEGGE